MGIKKGSIFVIPSSEGVADKRRASFESHERGDKSRKADVGKFFE